MALSTRLVKDFDNKCAKATPSLKEFILIHSIKICTCNPLRRSKSDISHIVAFAGPESSFTNAGKQTLVGDVLWVISKIQSPLRHCITGHTYILSSYSSHRGPKKAAVFYRFDEMSGSMLTISKGEDNWLGLHELSLEERTGLLRYTFAENAGMKCRCDPAQQQYRIFGVANRQAFGTVAISPQKMQHEQLHTSVIHFGVQKAELSPSEVMLISPYTDATTTQYLRRYLALHSKKPAFAGLNINPERSVNMLYNNLFGGGLFPTETEARHFPFGMLSEGSTEADEMLFELWKRNFVQALLPSEGDARTV